MFNCLSYSITERCGGTCSKTGAVSDAVKDLDDVFRGRRSTKVKYNFAGFTTLARVAQRDLDCNFQDHWLENNEYGMREVREKLVEGRMPFGFDVTPCADRK